jgi:hypothetical protein
LHPFAGRDLFTVDDEWKFFPKSRARLAQSGPHLLLILRVHEINQRRIFVGIAWRRRSIGSVHGMILARLFFDRRQEAPIGRDKFVRVAQQLRLGKVLGKLCPQKAFVGSIFEQSPNEIRHSR